MSNQYLSFDVTKQSTPQQLITGRQGDSQLKFVSVLLWDGDKNIPYDLTGKQIAFEALKPDGTHIVDYEGINILDASHGLFRYSFNEQVFAVAGKMQQAFFKIMHTDKDDQVIADSTLEISIHILENRVEFGINSTDYLSEYDNLISQVKQKFDDYAATVQDSIDKAQQVHDEVTALLAQVDDIKLAINRRVAVEDSDSINLSQSGDWETEAITKISGDIKISNQNHKSDNILSVDKGDNGGLYVPKVPPYKIDFSSVPFYYGAIDDIQQSVTQSVMMASDFTIYNVQANVNNAPDAERHATVSRLTPSGVIIDTMEILHSGHGSGWKLIEDGDKAIFVFIGLKNGVNKVVSLEYQPNARVDVFDDNVQGMTTYPNPSNEFGTFITDIPNDLIGLVRNDSDNDIVKIYNYSDFVSRGLGADVKYTFSIDVLTLQGAVLSNNHVYIYNSTIDVDDQKIIDLDITTGKINETNLGKLGQDPQLKYGQKLEGEDIATWTNPKTGEVSFIIAVATGYAGGTKRLVKMYMWNGPDNYPIFNKLFNEKVQSLKLYDGDGSAFTLDIQPENISDITTPGIYYFNGTRVRQFKDFPINYATGNDGFFLIVYPNNKSYALLQELRRLNYDDYHMRFVRTVDKRNGIVTTWDYDDGYANHTLKPVSALTKLSDLSQKGHYYLNTNEWAALTDVPKDPDLGYGTGGFFVTVSSMNTDNEFVQEALRNTREGTNVKFVRTVLKDTVGNWLVIK